LKKRSAFNAEDLCPILYFPAAGAAFGGFAGWNGRAGGRPGQGRRRFNVFGFGLVFDDAS
jgi:hypothetical protein